MSNSSRDNQSCCDCCASDQQNSQEHNQDTLGQSRRDFCLSAIGVGMGAAALAVPTYAGARMALYPLQQEGLSGKEYQLSTIDSLDETPRQFVVLDNVSDAWATTPNQTIGVVFLHRRSDGSVAAFQTVCPHAGCRVKAGVMKNPKTNSDEMLFYCPCHGDLFYLDGERVVPENSKSARSLDSLETRVDDSGRVYVKFQNFQLGTSEKKPV